MYIPKSQIKDNLFTPGGEWYYVKNNKNYTGFYYQLSNGKAYTGKTQNAIGSDEITQNLSILSSETNINSIPLSTEFVEYNEDWDDKNGLDLKIYGILKQTDYNLLRSIPEYSQQLPLLEDYEKGVFVRYFLLRANQLEYLEVNKKTYNNIHTKNSSWAWENYIPFTLEWYIKGDIDRTFNNNKGLIFIKEEELERKGLKEYLGTQYLQYFEYSEANNLTTGGGELLTPSGQNYIGSYHIHKAQGPMAGPTHMKTPHAKLFYKRFYKDRKVDSLNQEGVIKTEETRRIEFSNDLTVEYNMPSQINNTPPVNTNPSTGGGY